jgi:hypothetical protein
MGNHTKSLCPKCPPGQARPRRAPGLPCLPCTTAANHAARVAKRAQRIASDYAALQPEDFDVSVGNVGPTDGKAANEKRQEYNARMGEFASALQESGGDPSEIPQELGSYISGLAEQERRFGNRRLSRSISLAAAHAELSRQLNKQTAIQFFSAKIEPTGYALKGPGSTKKRTVVAHFSDLHLGAEMDARGNPMQFREVEEARRLEYFLRQILDYKPQYRKDSQLQVLIDGDVIDGFLQHDQRAGLPLSEQKAVFWHHFQRILALCSQQYPRVLVECQAGNHGRNIARHPGRATEDKWDGIEWDMYFALSQMCSKLPNVSFNIPFRAVSIVSHYGQNILVTHGDTEVKLGDPDTKARENAATLDRINSTRLYGVEFARGVHGHFHKGRINPFWLSNPALVPPNGHARGAGYIGEPCGQMLWEWTEGFPVGDIRMVEVGIAQDRDEKLGTLLPPFRFPKAGAM